MTNYKFIKAESLYDPEMIFYFLERETLEKQIDGIRFIEVTTDFKTAQFIRADSLKPIGFVMKQY